jgi:argininosuccinate synthase
VQGECQRIEANVWARWAAASGPARADVGDEAFVLTRAVPSCPDEPAFVDIDFENGTPVAINGIRMPMLELLDSLNAIAGSHGVGRLRSARPAVLYEAPAAAVLDVARRHLQTVRTSAALDRFSRIVAIQYADLVDEGRWFTPLRGALDAFVNRVQEHVTGVVRLRLLKGECQLSGDAAARGLLEPLPVAVSDIDDQLASGLMFGSDTRAEQPAPPAGAPTLVAK